MNESWKKVYDLSEDKKLVEQVQKVTLETEDYGLIPEIALYGSLEWWDAIDKGLIAKHEIQGLITDIYMSGHNDWPEFEVESNGQKTHWTRRGDENFYKIGSRVKIEYVVQKAKKSWTGNPEQNEVLRISIKTSNP